VPEMILVDTSVWVSHLRHGDPRLVDLLDEGSVLVHPFVIGELACGNLKNREEIFSLLGAFPQAAAGTLIFLPETYFCALSLSRLSWYLLSAGSFFACASPTAFS
jgi:hypothetical protein